MSSKSRNIIDLRKPQGRSASPKRSVVARTTIRAPRVSVAGHAARVSPLRQKRRRTRLIAFIVCIVIIVVGIFGLSYLSYLPRYSINAVTVEGAQTIPAPLIQRYVESQLNTGTHPFFSPNNIFLFNTNALENTLAGFFPRIKSVSVSRDSLLATAIAIKVQERQQFALWCVLPAIRGQASPSRCYSMDDTGFIFTQATDPYVGDTLATSTVTNGSSTTVAGGGSSTGLKIFSGGLPPQTEDSTNVNISTTTNSMDMGVDPIGHAFAPAHFPGILAFLDQLAQIGFTPTGAMVDSNGSDFIVPLKDGFDIKASFGQDVAGLVRNLQLILATDALQGKQNDLEYIDLRFGDRTYYKLKTTSATSTR